MSSFERQFVFINEPERDPPGGFPNSTGDSTQIHPVFQEFKVTTGEEVRAKGRHLSRIAGDVGQAAAEDFLSLPAAQGLKAGQREAVKTAFAKVTSETASHFQEGKLSGLEAIGYRRAALAQHVGYLTGEFVRKFPNLDEVRVKAILTQHFETPNAKVEDLASGLQRVAGGDAKVRAYVLDPGNSWRFSIGELDQALNRPGIYAGQAVIKFAEKLTGDAGKAKDLLQQFYDAKSEQLQKLLENPEGDLGLLVQFAARTAQSGWVVSKLGQGYVEAMAGKDKAVSRWNPSDGLMTSFDEMSAKKGWGEVAKDLDQIKTYLQTRFGDNFSSPVQNRGTHFVTDLEGNKAGIDRLVESGELRWVEVNGKRQLDFVHPKDPNEKLVFGGDLTDRGTDSFKLLEMMVDLKQRYPERVTLLWGNRDLNKLGLLHDLPAMEKGQDPGFDRWRAEQGKENTLENRVEYWFEWKGNPGGLDRHQQELSQLWGRPVSQAEAAQHYVDQVKPGGEFFEYLRLGQLLQVDKNVFYVHGGVTDENYGIVPGHTERVQDPRQWEKELNAWGQDQLEGIAQSYAAKGMGDHIPTTLLVYGDAIYDPKAVKSNGDRGVPFYNDYSVIYNFRQTEDGNFRGPSQQVVDYFKQSGIDTVIVGHSPFGDVPGPLKSPGFLLVMGDTSYSKPGADSSVTIDAFGGVKIKGTSSKSGQVGYFVSAKSSPPVGYITKDGLTVIGSRRTAEGGTEYLLAKYYNGFEIAEKVVSRRQLEAMEPRSAQREMTAEAGKHRQILIDSLNAKGKTFHSLDTVADAVIGDRKPVLFSGASKFGHYPASTEVVEQEVRAILDNLDPDKVILLTGGTDLGVEKIVHEVAKEKGFKVLGFIQEGAIPGEINLVDDLVLAGAKNQWSDPLLAALQVTKAKNGFAVFVGGGGVVTEGIAAAEQSGVDFYLMQKHTGIEGKGGASGEVARRRPERAFSTASDLHQMAAEVHADVFRFPSQEGKTPPAPLVEPASIVLLPPPAIDPHTAVDLPDFAKRTTQQTFDAFPKSLRRNHLAVILKKSEASGLEFASLAIEVDGKMVTTGENYLTSHVKTHVDGQDHYRLFQQAASDLHSEEGISTSGTLRIYDFHTHLTRVGPSFLIRSVNSVHEDGRPYTMTNDNDWKSFQDQFRIYVQELRKSGWTGPIEMVAGALPAQNADSAATLDPALAKQPYVTATTLRVEAEKFY